jgi:glycosyltransferase involved in cell wall biosynthesis
MGAAPTVSVVMPVRNEAQYLDEQLAALSRQTLTDPWELIVVDNGSTDDSRDIVRAWQDRIPGLRLECAPDAVGTGEARNRGVDVARAELIAFCDGDDVVHEGWLAAMVTALGQHDVVTGHNELDTLNTPAARSYLPTLHRARQTGSIKVIAGCNYGVHRRTWVALGGATDELGIGEDVDFGVRAHVHGSPTVYVPDAIVHRRLPDTARGVFRQHRGYGRSQVLMRDRHGDLVGRPSNARVITRDAAFVVLRVHWLLDHRRRFRYAMVAGRLSGRVTALLQPAARRRARNGPAQKNDSGAT